MDAMTWGIVVFVLVPFLLVAGVLGFLVWQKWRDGSR